ncbi:IS630 family transposase, partial [Xanthomonas oryzae]
GREEPGTGLGAYPAGAADGVGVRRRHQRLRAPRHHDAVCRAGRRQRQRHHPVQTQHRHQEFLSFLRHVDAQVPQDLDVHLICDNDATHKHARIKAWLAKRPRYHIHYTPTYSSWLNQIERWFGLITQRAIRRDSFDSVADLKRKINAFVEHYNQNPRPFKWTATADSILAKIERLCKVINGTRH